MKTMKTDHPPTVKIERVEDNVGNIKNDSVALRTRTRKRKADTFEQDRSGNMPHRTKIVGGTLLPPSAPPKGHSILQRDRNEQKDDVLFNEFGKAAIEAHKRGLPLVTFLTGKNLENATELLFFHSEKNERCDKIPLRLFADFDEENIFLDACLTINKPGIDPADANVTRVLVAGLLSSGILGIEDIKMAHDILKAMNSIDRLKALSSGLQGVIGLNLNVTKGLLELGADPNRPSDDDGWLPLEAAIATGEAKFVKALLDKGANPDIVGDKGITPRQYAQAEGEPSLTELIPTNVT
ncbi:MAG: ankyrin repeat domain-containing protein [Cytophagaceae bacterium]|nr:MAG: ankyrin repeat domain-containing protein [Cytophagaceae bacterium]